MSSWVRVAVVESLVIDPRSLLYAIHRENMRSYRRSAMLVAAICAVAGTMGGMPAHADSAAQSKAQLIQSAALWLTPPPGKAETAKDGTTTEKVVCGPPYLTGDPDLGPVSLPRTGYLGKLLRGYAPLGNLEPQPFLSSYWDYAVNNYRFPPDAGFARSGNYPNGRPLVKTTFLQIGMKLDRFGGYTGAFLSPIGDPFISRSLPPRSLNTNPQDPGHPCNYHAFRVLKSFRVDVGPAAPAFQQPGGGTQYHVLSKYIPEAPQTSEEVPVSWLLQNEYLEEIAPPSLPDVKDETGQRPGGRGTGIHGASSQSTSGKADRHQLSRVGTENRSHGR
ncbi:TNT domain-containing protein [Nonomuraea sp. NPDC005983]|uniref:TNT domain-containing protein n=1 Tax=Nonomuraea sp. NPDC005983 TaxID=3155595 RepID=UPI0033BEB4FF